MKGLKLASVAASVVLGAAASATAGIADWGLVNDPAVLAKAQSLPVYTKAALADTARDPKVLGQVWATVCTFQNDPAVAQAATLDQLKARAVLKGANGLVDVTYQVANNNAHSSCYHRGYTATGYAVVVN